MPTARGFLAATALAVAACRPTTPAPEWHQEQGYRWRELAVPRGGRPGFTQLSSDRTGIEFANFVSDSALLRNQLLADGGGVALGDVNGDGLADLYFCRTEGPNALYINEGNWRFREVAREAGVALGDRASTGAVLADIDGDGDLDLLVSALGGPNALFLNYGQGRFTEDTTYLGRASRAGSTTMTLADVDGNGSLDLYVANYKAYTALDIYSPAERAFEQVVEQTGPMSFAVKPAMRKDYKVVMRHDLGSVVLVQRADPDWFYLNDGKGRFTAEPLRRNPRFRNEDGQQLAEDPEQFGLAARFYDVNGDLAPDLYVVNDFEDPDQFWINDGRGSFRLVPRLAQRTSSNAGMAVDFGDFNRDGLVDFYEVDMLSKDTRQLRTQIPTHTALPKQPGVLDDRPQLQRNTLFL
ncbi:MAG: FG-GAP repeat domain-containing protein, partial [Gemmatimonadales bacterium]